MIKKIIYYLFCMTPTIIHAGPFAHCRHQADCWHSLDKFLETAETLFHADTGRENQEHAAKLYHAIIEFGDHNPPARALAWVRFGEMHFYGMLNQYNGELAYKYFCIAATQYDNRPAQLLAYAYLGHMYTHGIYVKKDNDMARKLLAIVVEQSQDQTSREFAQKNLDLLPPPPTQEDLEAARLLASPSFQ